MTDSENLEIIKENTNNTVINTKITAIMLFVIVLFFLLLIWNYVFKNK